MKNHYMFNFYFSKRPERTQNWTLYPRMDSVCTQQWTAMESKCKLESLSILATTSHKQKVLQHRHPTPRYSMSVLQPFVCQENSELGNKIHMKVKCDSPMLKRIEYNT